MARRAVRALRNFERVAWWAVVAPVLGLLPAALGYRIACWRGDWMCRQQAAKRAELSRNLRLVLGSQLGPAAEQEAIRDWFRFSSCEAMDVMRLRRQARALRKLVEIRGREHLEAAMAAGKGALLCSAHFGSFDSGFSMLTPSGFPTTTIGRWQHKYTVGMSAGERKFWDFFYARPLRKLRHRPNLEPWPGRLDIATKAAAMLRAGEVVTISVDVPPLDADRARAIEVSFLGGRARLLPGVVTLAKVTGAPVLPCFMYRSADYRHQVLEISAPVPMEGSAEVAFGRCAAVVSAAITRSPASWRYFASGGDLADLELITAPTRAATPVAAPVGSPVAAPLAASAAVQSAVQATGLVPLGGEPATREGAADQIATAD